MKAAGSREQRVRLVDRILAALGLLGSAPVLALAAIGIKFSDEGPVVYRARRAGLEGHPFTMFKLRTMRTTSNVVESVRITGGIDTRVFPFGRLLRRFKIDELPQLFNILRGDMAIVGPRPEDPSIVEREYVPWMRETLRVFPGLTSPGSLDYYADERCLPDDQVDAEAAYLRDLLPRKLAVDIVYVRHRSASYDALLVLRTVFGLMGAHSAFRSSQAWEKAEAQRILNEEAKG